MRFQTVTLRERFLAHAALVRSLSVVRPHVNRQVLLSRTRLPANAAHEQFQPQVAPHVRVQVSLTLKVASALRAAVRRLTGVNAQVHL